jgi:hypothetical protein
VSRRRMHLVSLLGAVFTLLAASTATAATSSRASNPFCSRLGHSIEASSGAQMYCFGARFNGAAPHPLTFANPLLATPFSGNVNAASLSEDVSPGGARAYGQSETSVAATGPYVVEAWNDATSFFSTCPAPMSKEEGTGFGFSANSGASFTDAGGLPNSSCASHLFEGDPSVEAWQPGGIPYFYIASLYSSVGSDPVNELALSVCHVVGSGASARLLCGQPVVAATSTQCATLPGGGPFFCSFLDKDYLTIDPRRGRLYMTYTEFGPDPTTSSFNGQIEVAVCDIGTPGGGRGPAGGTAGAPKCEHGSTASQATPITLPYFTIAAGDPNCQSEGAYPGVDTASGDLYTAYEFNQTTNIFNPACFNTPTQNVLVRVQAACLVLQPTSICGAPAGSTAQAITSLDGAFIPGYNRFPANDFPRVAVDPSAGTVSMVWNDAGVNPLGDIMLRSYALHTLVPVQAAPVVLNTDAGGLHFLPAVRNVSATGKLAVTWYDRTGPNSAVTSVSAALGIDPRLTRTPSSNTRVTTAPTDWNNVSSDIVPNFGDYTDNYVASGKLHVAWSDGRLGVPQPFHASIAMP